MLTDLDYELLSAYIDGALTESERAAFELRLQSEPELSRELDELRATVTLLNNLPPLKAPRDFTLDARYARRSSFFFTSATFSALSTAAAIILFALGAYLFTGNKAQAPAASSQQVAQSAFLVTPTADSLDKSSQNTATRLADENLIAPTDTGRVDNSLATEAALAGSSSLSQESTADDQSPLFHTDVAQPTATSLPNDGIVAGSAPSVPSVPDAVGRTSEATETLSNEQYGSNTPNSGGDATGGSGMPSPIEPPQAQANVAPSFAATQLPFTATAAPSSTAVLKATSVPTITDTFTPLPSATSARQQSPTATELAAELSLPALEEKTTPPDSLPLLLVGVGMVLLLVGIGTTIIRRRNRS